jgi:hypothetical protein
MGVGPYHSSLQNIQILPNIKFFRFSDFGGIRNIWGYYRTTSAPSHIAIAAYRQIKPIPDTIRANTPAQSVFFFICFLKCLGYTTGTACLDLPMSYRTSSLYKSSFKLHKASALSTFLETFIKPRTGIAYSESRFD